MNVKKAFIHANYYDFDQYREDQYVIFADTIEKVGPMAEFSANKEEIMDCTGLLVMPSLVLGHTHIYSEFARGLSLPFHPQSFLEILQQLWWKIDRQIDQRIGYASGIAAASELIKNGVTAIIDHHAAGKEIVGSLAVLKNAVCDDAGMRAAFCFETSDRFAIEQCITENRTFLSLKPNAFSSGFFGLHASMTLSKKTLDAVKNVLGNSPIHIHVAESKEDEEDCISKYGCRIVERLERHGLLNEHSIIAHGLYTDENELSLIRKRNAVLALNVTSNMNNGVGLPDFAKLKKAGVTCIIGNDGISSSATLEYLNLYYSAHLKEGVNAFSLSDLLAMIQNTYRFVGDRFGVKLGKIQPGYAADLLTVPYIPPTPMSQDNAFGHLFFGLFQSFRPNNVFVAGKPLLTNYALRPALEKKLNHTSKEAKRLWDEIRKGDLDESIHHV